MHKGLVRAARRGDRDAIVVAESAPAASGATAPRRAAKATWRAWTAKLLAGRRQGPMTARQIKRNDVGDAATGMILSQIAQTATEAAAIASARHRGFGRKNEADQAAVDAMRRAFQFAPFSGKVVIGEGEIDEA